MNDAGTLLAHSERMLQAAEHQDWSTVERLDPARRALLEALTTTPTGQEAERLLAIDRRLMAIVVTERARLGELAGTSRRLDRVADRYADITGKGRHSVAHTT